jgi:hypothetical protein
MIGSLHRVRAEGSRAGSVGIPDSIRVQQWWAVSAYQIAKKVVAFHALPGATLIEILHLVHQAFPFEPISAISSKAG